ncbi:hypothetical protein OAD30_04570, partial [Alphaproteobacteria bacterium]|nr:hypothetical protein [Alphaproteobacteria bacterium]
IQSDELTYNFQSKASITNQTGGWMILNIEGKTCLSLFEKLLTVNLEDFHQGKVIRTIIVNINCFVLCRSKFNKYCILCPISFYQSMRVRLEKLIKSA